MKTTIKQLAAVLFFALLFIGGTVSAKGIESKASSHEINVEATLELEDWMLDYSIWDTGNSMLLEESRDENLLLEGWMTDSKTWEIDSFTVVTETEQDLAIEQWMINENIWKM